MQAIESRLVLPGCDGSEEPGVCCAFLEWLAWHRALLALRATHIVPRLVGGARGARHEAIGAGGIAVDWTLGDGARLRLRANFSAAPEPGIARAPGVILHAEGDCGAGPGLAPWSGLWTLEPA